MARNQERNFSNDWRNDDRYERPERDQRDRDGERLLLVRRESADRKRSNAATRSGRLSNSSEGSPAGILGGGSGSSYVSGRAPAG